MSTPRGAVVDPRSVQILHVFNRCVRRTFLCGVDAVSGRDYSHRKAWLRRRLEFLVGVFAFDIATFAVMSNHFHLVLRSRPDIVDRWSDQEVARRNMRLQGKRWFRVDGTLRKSGLAEIERIVSDPEEVLRLRRKLSDISSLMAYFDRHVANRANREDQVTGAFWEGTFGAEPIEDEASLLACMAYVDLNPIRAMMAESLEESDYTGAFERINELRRDLALGRKALDTERLGGNDGSAGAADLDVGSGTDGQPDGSLESIDAASFPLEKLCLTGSSTLEWERGKRAGIGWLAPIELDEQGDGLGQDHSGRRPSRKGFLPISLARYLELVDWAGRAIRSDKPGSIPATATPVLEQLGLSPAGLLGAMEQLTRRDRYFQATERRGSPEMNFDAAVSA